MLASLAMSLLAVKLTAPPQIVCFLLVDLRGFNSQPRYKQQFCRKTSASNITAEPWTLHRFGGKTSLLFLCIFSVKSVTRSCVMNAKPQENR
jgi:hypothetical protein